MNVTPPSGPAVSGDARTVGSFYPFGVAGRGMWVRSEYAGELSVLSAWLCALLPWAVSTRTLGESRLFRPHFHYAFLQFVPGADLGRALDPFVAVYDGPGFPANPTTAVGYQWWLVGAVVFTLVLAWSVLYYVYDEQLEARSPAEPGPRHGRSAGRGCRAAHRLGVLRRHRVLRAHRSGRGRLHVPVRRPVARRRAGVTSLGEPQAGFIRAEGIPCGSH